jgi:tetrahydromethanopterin S-methyltransferase subunit C
MKSFIINVLRNFCKTAVYFLAGVALSVIVLDDWKAPFVALIIVSVITIILSVIIESIKIFLKNKM